MPIPTLAVSKPRAINSELTYSQSSSFIAQNSFEKIKFNNEKTTAGTGRGYEQALGH
jgi:hypothetical protein